MSDKIERATFRRKFISLDEKVQILDRLVRGEKASHIAKTLNLNEATIRTIKKNEEKIRGAVAAGSSISAMHAARPRAPIMEKMEKALSVWMDCSCQKRIPLDNNIIKEKALKIYKHLKENGENSTNPDFVASKGWFEKFKKRYAINSIKLQSEPAAIDYKANKRFYAENQTVVINDQSYIAHQVFNTDETALWWKEVPDRTFIPDQENKPIGDDEQAAPEDGDLIRDEEICVADLLEMVSDVNKSDAEENNSTDGGEVGKLTITKLREGLKLAKELETFFANADPSVERARKFVSDLQKSLVPYQEIHNELARISRKTKITYFRKRANYQRKPKSRKDTS